MRPVGPVIGFDCSLICRIKTWTQGLSRQGPRPKALLFCWLRPLNVKTPLDIGTAAIRDKERWSHDRLIFIKWNPNTWKDHLIETGPRYTYTTLINTFSILLTPFLAMLPLWYVGVWWSSASFISRRKLRTSPSSRRLSSCSSVSRCNWVRSSFSSRLQMWFINDFCKSSTWICTLAAANFALNLNMILNSATDITACCWLKLNVIFVNTKRG